MIFQHYLTPATVFVTTILFGIWVSRSGKPYNGILFNIHKLVALAGVIISVIQLVRTFKAVEPPPAIIALFVLAGMCVLALFISGAVLSASGSAPRTILLVHKAAMIGAIVLVASMTCLLNTGVGNVNG